MREVLHRDLYRGIVTWNKTKKRDASGDVAPVAEVRRQHWVRTYREDLRIVTDEQWEAAHALIRKARSLVQHADRTRGRIARRDYDSNYLLTGFVRCDTCGGLDGGRQPTARRSAGLLLRLSGELEAGRDHLPERPRAPDAPR